MQTPSEFVTSYALIGQKKSTNAATKLLVLGVLAGFLIGMGAMVTNTAGHALTNPSVAKIVSGLLFPFGLIMVILTGAELFTGNCLITISVLEKKVNWLGMLRNWFYVYLGNFIGSLLLAMACAYSGPMNLNNNGVAVYTMKVAAGKCALTFGNAVVLGILCNVLVCIAVAMSLMSKNTIGRAIGAYLPIAFFVIAGFEHSVANMYYISAGLFAKNIPAYVEAAAAADLVQLPRPQPAAGHPRQHHRRLQLRRSPVVRPRPGAGRDSRHGPHGPARDRQKDRQLIAPKRPLKNKVFIVCILQTLIYN